MSSRLPYTLGVLAMIGIVAWAWLGRGSFEVVAPGEPAPELGATNLEGEPVTLEHYRGRVILLNIWATWCPPCVEEMPSLENLEARVDDPDFEVVAVSVDAREGERDASGRPGGDIGAFLDEHELDLTVLHDPSGRIQRRYRTTGVPESFLIDRDGVIVRRIVGPAVWDTDAWVEVVERTLGADAG